MNLSNDSASKRLVAGKINDYTYKKRTCLQRGRHYDEKRRWKYGKGYDELF